VSSCQTFINYAFTVLKLNRLVIYCASENLRSRAIPERLGFVHEGAAREAEWLYDHFVDLEIYSLLHRDWSPQNLAQP
jgi:ribosomal-protein-serine acetyltransferase